MGKKKKPEYYCIKTTPPLFSGKETDEIIKDSLYCLKSDPRQKLFKILYQSDICILEDVFCENEKIFINKSDLIKAPEHTVITARLKGFDFSLLNVQISQNDIVLQIIEKLDKENNVKLAIFSAELVLELFEKKHPEDKRPRLAIEVAKKCLKDRSTAAACAAYDAACAAYDAAGVAYDPACAAAGVAYDPAYYAACAAYDAAKAACVAYDPAYYADSAAYAAANATCAAAKSSIYKKIIEYGLSISTVNVTRRI